MKMDFGKNVQNAFDIGGTIERRRKSDKFVGKAGSFPYSAPHVDCGDVSWQAS